MQNRKSSDDTESGLIEGDPTSQDLSQWGQVCRPSLALKRGGLFRRARGAATKGGGDVGGGRVVQPDSVLIKLREEQKQKDSMVTPAAAVVASNHYHDDDEDDNDDNDGRNDGHNAGDDNNTEEPESPNYTILPPLASGKASKEEERQKLFDGLKDEIARLKAENKNLQFKLIFSPPSQSAHGTGSSRPAVAGQEQGASASNPELLDANQERLLQEEIEDLRTALVEQRDVSAQLRAHIDQMNHIYQQKPFSQANAAVARQALAMAAEHARNTSVSAVPPQQQQHQHHTSPPMATAAPGAANTRPLVARAIGPDAPTHRHLPKVAAAAVETAQTRGSAEVAVPADLASCHVMIHALRKDNVRKAHELGQLKADLNDLLYSNKWTPDAFLLAKAYTKQPNTSSAAAAAAATGQHTTTGTSKHFAHKTGMGRGGGGGGAGVSLPAINQSTRTRDGKPLVPYSFPRTLDTSEDFRLPALKPKAPSHAGRQRNVQAVQKARQERQ
ncbi:uncharacterized protein LOC135820918 isoform X2 [Sycon ciliatum]|uniref:uncharacterized protein LOC135820918 isoform X2 n=1 Tax=Sycon ciliatum TaxID=27933 RepID=UPI0031F6041B